MSRLSAIFEKSSRCFIPFLTAGYPDLEATRAMALAMADNGADIIELGIPFSDPVADGPVIQKSSFEALQKGYSMPDYFALVRSIRKKSEVGLIFMSYLNPLLKYGLEKLDEEASHAGLDGILISDLTPEAYSRLTRPLCLDTIFLAAPTSSEDRLRKICAATKGFLYLVARTGVTGGRTDIEALVPATVSRIRRYTEVPIGVGFGIASAADVQAVWQYAEGAIVGSAIVQFIQENHKERNLAEKVGEYTASFLR
jgi:tryptophan synthase alpha chain